MAPEVGQALAKLGQRAMWVGDDDFVFISQAGGYMDHSVTVRAYKRALGNAGLRPIKLHGLRHSFGTLAVQAFPLSDVQAWMGHADIAITMRYIHYVPKHDAAQRLARLLGDANLAPNSRSSRSAEEVASA
jgi:integrase